MIKNLSLALGELANSTAPQRSLDSLAKVVLENHIALDYILAEREAIFFFLIANATCYIWLNGSGEIKTQLHKIRELTHWLQQISPDDLFSFTFRFRLWF